MSYQEKDVEWRSLSGGQLGQMGSGGAPFSGLSVGGGSANRQADKARMDVALDELESALGVLGDSAKQMCNRVQRVSRPDLSTTMAGEQPQPVKDPTGAIIGHIDSLAEKARKIAHRLQDALNRLEV